MKSTNKLLLVKLPIMKLLLSLLVPVVSFAQDLNQNWVKQTTYKLETSTPYTNPTAAQAESSVTYLDGLGRPVLEIAGKQSGTGTDLVRYIAYDAYGRQAKQYLPYAPTTNNLQFAGESQALAGLGQQAEYTGNQFFSETAYEPSPLNRVLKQAAPGTLDSWAMGSGHEVKYDYAVATTADKVKNLSVVSDAIVDNGFLVNLYKSTVTDEDDNKTETYTNTKGLLVLKRQFLAGSKGSVINVDTYYLYNSKNALAYVIPPAAATLTGTTPMENLCYQYKYDDSQRLVEKKEPGKEWEYIIYDRLNRIVAVGPTYSPFGSIDNVKGWVYSFYDAYGRVCYTGWVQHAFAASSRQNLQSLHDSGAITPVVKTAAGVTNSLDGFSVRYTITGVPTGLKVLTVNYYDNYDFPGFYPTVFPANAYYNASRKPVGLATGSWARLLTSGTINGESSYILYDYRGQAILTAKKNHLGKTTETRSLLNFTAKPETVVTIQQPLTGTVNLTITEAFTYTDQGRLQRHTHQNNTDAVQLLSYNHYNSLGQLVTKMVGNTDVSGATALQKVDYSYNIRGWLKGINDVGESMQPGTQNGTANDLFAYRLNYNDNVYNTGDNLYDAKQCYNGNISETLWRSASDNHLRKYGYNYDRLGRLREAIYQKPEGLTPTRGSYDERINYDINGNIGLIQRHGNLDTQSLPLEIDNLQYYYDEVSNRLRKIHDASNSTVGFQDNAGSVNSPPASSADWDYNYDDKGNQTYDKNKGITSIIYNHLNLPVEIVFNSDANTKITYIYTASGSKVQKVVKTTVAAGVITNYIGGFQYKNTTLDFFPVSGGYVKNTVLTGNTYNYVFHYLDQVGNIRLSYARDESLGIKILEENHYYPYGLKHTNYNNSLNAFKANETQTEVVLRAQPQQASYPYKFNGMEWQDELGLNLYDMDLRDYDPAIGRWTGIDPVTHHSQSPYNAFDSNPVSIADPSGADGVGMGGATINTWHYAGGNSFNSFLNGGAGNLGYGDHTLGGSGNRFWMGQGAVTGGFQSNPFSLSGNNLSINWNRVSNGTKWNVASDNVYLWHEDSVTYNGEFTLGEGGRLDSVNTGYWEKIAEYGGYFTDILSGKAQLDSDTFFRYGTRYASNFELMAENSARMQNISKWAGRVGYGFNVVPVGTGFYKDNWTYGKNAQKATAIATGNIIGAEAGALIGAKAFALAFAWTGPGAVAAGIIGGVAGAFIGGYYGGELAEYMYSN